MFSSTTPTGDIMSKRLSHFPNNVLYSGSVYGDSLINRGGSGSYWSSTADSGDYAYSSSFGFARVNPGTGRGNKYYGMAIRCTTTTPAP